MDKRLKAILAIMMILTLLVCGNISVFAERIEHTGENTEIDWNYDETTETIYFTGHGEIPDYFFRGAIPDDYEGDASDHPTHITPWLDYAENTKHIVFEEGIRRVGWYCFTEFGNLETMTIPESMVDICYTFPIYKKITIIAYQLSAAELAATEHQYEFVPLSAVALGDVDNSGSLDADDALSV